MPSCGRRRTTWGGGQLTRPPTTSRAGDPRRGGQSSEVLEAAADNPCWGSLSSDLPASAGLCGSLQLGHSFLIGPRP